MRFNFYFFNPKFFLMTGYIKDVVVVLVAIVIYDMFVKGLIEKQKAGA